MCWYLFIGFCASFLINRILLKLILSFIYDSYNRLNFLSIFLRYQNRYLIHKGRLFLGYFLFSIFTLVMQLLENQSEPMHK
jgi:hypothetical protein